MEVDAIGECQKLSLKTCHAWIVVQKVKIKVPVQVLMDRSIPFSGILIEISSIPKVLIELPITKTSELSVEICAKIKYQKEHREIQCHNGKIPAWKNKM